jgi:hypothetical protein
LLTITLPNWNKFNPRSDRANYTWFRLQNDFFHDQRVFGLTDQQKLLYLFVLCEASKRNQGTATFSAKYASAVLGHAAEEITKDCTYLAEHGLFEVEVVADSRQPAVTAPSVYHATNVTNERNERDETNETVTKAPTTRSARAAPETGAVWAAYSQAYFHRYGVDPVRNARVNSQLAQFVKRVAAEEAPLIAEFYVQHNRSFYVQKSHPVGLMLQDAESLRTEWKNGRAVLTQDAKSTERKQATWNAFSKYFNDDKGGQTNG